MHHGQKHGVANFTSHIASTFFCREYGKYDEWIFMKSEKMKQGKETELM